MEHIILFIYTHFSIKKKKKNVWVISLLYSSLFHQENEGHTNYRELHA